MLTASERSVRKPGPIVINLEAWKGWDRVVDFLLVEASMADLVVRIPMEPIVEEFMAMEVDTEETHRDSRTRVAEEIGSKNTTSSMKGL